MADPAIRQYVWQRKGGLTRGGGMVDLLDLHHGHVEQIIATGAVPVPPTTDIEE